MLLSALLFLTPLIALATLNVDFSHVQSVKEELQCATDAAARYAAAGMLSQLQSVSGATPNATASFLENRVDGQPFAFNPATDLQLGLWIQATRTFVVTTLAGGANAVRINTHLLLGTAAHPLTFLSIFNKTIMVGATSIAMISGQDASTYVAATGNPWLSGVPLGGVTTDFRTSPAEWDFAGVSANLASSPATVGLSTLNVVAGQTITFDGVTGGANFGPMPITTDADGDPTLIVTLGSPAFNDYTYFNSPMNGMSNIKAPISCMTAVFLDDTDPRTTAAPTPLDFSTTTSRDFVSLSPKLKQTFFVGDGRRSSTGEVQQIVVPTGATRVFIANMDGWQYNNNIGGYYLTIHANHKVTSVLLR